MESIKRLNSWAKCSFLFIFYECGLIGVAWSMGIPLFLSKIFVQPWYVSRVLEMPYLEYLWALTKPFVLGILVFLVGGVLFYSHLKPNFGILLAFSSVHLIIYSAILFFVGVLPEERIKLLNLVKKRKI